MERIRWSKRATEAANGDVCSALSVLCICRSASSSFKERRTRRRGAAFDFQDYRSSVSRPSPSADTLAASNMWRIASMTRSTISQGSLSEFPVVKRRNLPRAQADPFRLPSFNIADACSVFRIAARTLPSDNLKVYSERRSF